VVVQPIVPLAPLGLVGEAIAVRDSNTSDVPTNRIEHPPRSSSIGTWTTTAGRMSRDIRAACFGLASIGITDKADPHYWPVVWSMRTAPAALCPVLCFPRGRRRTARPSVQ